MSNGWKVFLCTLLSVSLPASVLITINRIHLSSHICGCIRWNHVIQQMLAVCVPRPFASEHTSFSGVNPACTAKKKKTGDLD